MHKIQARILQQGITMVCMQQGGRGQRDMVIYRRGVRVQVRAEGETSLPTRLWYHLEDIEAGAKGFLIEERVIIESIRTKVRYAKEGGVCACEK